MPAQLFHEFLAADSKGVFFNQRIKPHDSMHEARWVTVEGRRYPITDGSASQSRSVFNDIPGTSESTVGQSTPLATRPAKRVV